VIAEQFLVLANLDVVYPRRLKNLERGLRARVTGCRVHPAVFCADALHPHHGEQRNRHRESKDKKEDQHASVGFVEI
jgi:hypothetical protein